jgi:UPF0755 protein
MKVVKALGWLIALSLAAVVLAYVVYLRLLDAPLSIKEPFVFEVKRGESMHAVIARLHDKGVIEEPRLAKLYVRIEGLGQSLRAGEFEIQPGLSTVSLFALLSSNKQIKYKVTLVEGSTFSDARLVLKSHPKLSVVTQEMSDMQVLERLQGKEVSTKAAGNTGDIPTKDQLRFTHPEGSIYPDTYFFHKGDTDLSILKRAHQRLVEVLSEEWPQRQQNLPLVSPYEALILASIVEKETGKPSERSEIAGVFVRRLQKGMRLQTDPTVIYGLGDRYNGNITRKHLREMTPYNTYRINGLPPTPIALAGRAAIHAALHPLDGKTLYFVAKGDGSHAFSETIEEHNKAVRQFQLRRRSDYRSTHTESE